MKPNNRVESSHPGRGRTSIVQHDHSSLSQHLKYDQGDDGPDKGPDQKGGDAAKGGKAMAVCGSWIAMASVSRSCITYSALQHFNQMPVAVGGHAAPRASAGFARSRLLATRQSFNWGGAGV